MILRRVVQHVRKQEWTAIVIDLLIVVVGVYMGIQAQAWNTTRENRNIEQQYLLSLHDEITFMIENWALVILRVCWNDPRPRHVIGLILR